MWRFAQTFRRSNFCSRGAEAIVIAIRKQIGRSLTLFVLAAATSIRPITRGGMGLRQWARSPIKMTIDEFLAAIQEKIVADRVFDPIAVTQDRLGVIASFVTTG